VPVPSLPDVNEAPPASCEGANTSTGTNRRRCATPHRSRRAFRRRALAIAISLALWTALSTRTGPAIAQDTSPGTSANSPLEQPPPSGEVTVAPAVTATPAAAASGGGGDAAGASPGNEPVAAETATPAPASPAPIASEARVPAADGASTVASKTANGADAKGPASSPFEALASPSAGPMHIQSDSLSVDYKKNSAMWRGHVHASRADGQLTSDSLKVSYGKDFHELQNMVAIGNVRISRGTQWSTSNQAVLDQAKQTVVLTGNPVVHDGTDQIAGSRITVYLKTGESVVEGAKAVIFPRPSKTRDNGVSADHGK